VQTGRVARFGDGLAEDADLVIAATRATTMALAPLDGARPDLLAVFVCGDDPEAVGMAMDRAADLAGADASIGCSATGVIGDGRGVEARSSVAVWCGVLPGVKARSFALEVMPAEAGMAVVGMPERREDDAVAVILADPWSFPVDGFVEQSNEALGGLPLVGGMAAGARGRGSSRLMVDGRVVERGAVGVLLSGPVAARTVVSQGCRPVGPAMTVTASDQNVIFELAGMPALTKLQEILSALPPEEQAMVTGGLQLGIARDEYVEEHGQGDFLIRGIAGASEGGTGLVVGDLVPVGRTVRFQVRDAAAAGHDLREALEGFRLSTAPDQTEGALLFSCNGRGAQLFGTADHDPLLVREVLAPIGVAGCFAAGEIGPVAGRNFVHGFTASILAFGPTTAAADLA
jgi:small ligand-binding sensory domain FIST